MAEIVFPMRSNFSKASRNMDKIYKYSIEKVLDEHFHTMQTKAYITKKEPIKTVSKFLEECDNK